MGLYRQLKVGFWTSPFVLDLLPEERYFYNFLLTNPATTQCGIYELSSHMMCTQFGYSLEQIEGLIQKFVSYKKIIYSPQTKEFLIINWMKHNRPDNPKVLKCVQKEIGQIKDQRLLELWKLINPQDCASMGLGNGMDTVTIPYGYRLDTVFSKWEEITKNKNKEEEQQQEEQEVKKEEKKEKTHTNKELEQATEQKNKASVCEDFSRSVVGGIMSYLNQKAGTLFPLDTPATTKLIVSKLALGYTSVDFFAVIDKKQAEWQGKVYESSLTPFTLFGDKFEMYLAQKPRSEIQKPSKPPFGPSRIPISTFTSKVLREV
jgi:uncharacterized phage protein (TIGR02220 family)